MRWTVAGSAVGVAAVAVGVAVRLGGGAEEVRGYGQGSAEAALGSAFAMIEAGDAGRLPDLLEAESEAMRAALDELALVCAELQDVASASAVAFPEEAARLRAAMRSDPGGTFAALAPRRGTIDPSGGPGREMLRAVLADPYGWLVAQRERLTVVAIDDTRSAVLRDGRPVFGVGLMMVESDDGLWRVRLPLRFPGSARFVPQNDDEWSIVGSMLRVIAAAVDELEGEIRSGAVRDTSDAARLAGEKALGPIVLCTVAYRRAIEARGE